MKRITKDLRSQRPPRRRVAKIRNQPAAPAVEPATESGGGETTSILAASVELGVARDSIRRKLVAAGWREGSVLRWRDIVRALAGDKAAALARRAAADAEMAEHKLRVATREVIPLDEAADYVRRTFGPVREQAVAMPSILAARVNPTDPAHARAHLEAWVDGFLRHCRARTPEREGADVGSDDEKPKAAKKAKRAQGES